MKAPTKPSWDGLPLTRVLSHIPLTQQPHPHLLPAQPALCAPSSWRLLCFQVTSKACIQSLHLSSAQQSLGYSLEKLPRECAGAAQAGLTQGSCSQQHLAPQSGQSFSSVPLNQEKTTLPFWTISSTKQLFRDGTSWDQSRCDSDPVCALAKVTQLDRSVAERAERAASTMLRGKSTKSKFHTTGDLLPGSTLVADSKAHPP